MNYKKIIYLNYLFLGKHCIWDSLNFAAKTITHNTHCKRSP